MPETAVHVIDNGKVIGPTTDKVRILRLQKASRQEEVMEFRGAA